MSNEELIQKVASLERRLQVTVEALLWISTEATSLIGARAYALGKYQALKDGQPTEEKPEVQKTALSYSGVVQQNLSRIRRSHE